MANNGYLAAGICYPSPVKSLSCPSAGPVVAVFSSDGGASYYRYSCYTAQLVPVYVGTLSITPNCEIPGNTTLGLTETEQIQAVNQFLPYALAFLAAIWGGKKVFELLWGAAFRPRRVSDPE